MRSPENVLESLKSKACNKSYKYERLYRNLYNPQFYLLAYQRIQAKLSKAKANKRRMRNRQAKPPDIPAPDLCG